MAEINKQKKSRSQVKKSYYAAQFARTAKNKARNVKRAKAEELKHHIKRDRRGVTHV
jgi:hypothetical protein